MIAGRQRPPVPRDLRGRRAAGARRRPTLPDEPRPRAQPRRAGRADRGAARDRRHRARGTERLTDAGVPAAPVADVADVAGAEQTQALGILQHVPHPRIRDLTLAGAPAVVRRRAAAPSVRAARRRRAHRRGAARGRLRGRGDRGALPRKESCSDMTGHLSASFSATLRVHLPDSPGSFARLAQAIGDAGGLLGAIDLVRVEPGMKVRDVTVEATRRGPPRADRRPCRPRARRRRGRARLRPHLPAPSRRKDRDALRSRRSRRGTTSRWPTRRASPGSRPRSPPTRGAAWTLTSKQNTVAVVTDGTAVLGLGRHRPGGGDAGDGRQGGALQGVRGRRRVADLPRDHGPRRDRRGREGDRAEVRRDQPRGHLLPALLRDRAPPPRGARRSRSSTTTSTERRSSSLAALLNALHVVGKRLEDARIVTTGVGAAGIAVTDILLPPARER